MNANALASSLSNLSKPIGINDYLCIRPISGKSTKIKLNRTRYLITSNRVSEPQTIELPTLSKDSFSLELKLVSSTDEKSTVFILNSLDGKAFIHNKSLVLSALVKAGDTLDLGHNELKFSKVSLNKDNEFKIPNKILNSDLSLLIQGETGTGKTHLAKKLHHLTCPHKPFIHINIASYSASLLESELFGHVKGAFTGALSDKKGALKEADGGILFIDEVDSLPLEIQTKLLLFLDDKSFRRVGSSKVEHSKCRVIFSSGQDLKTLVEKEKMRKDFFFRLQTSFLIKLEPLRMNKELIKNICYQKEQELGVIFSTKLKDMYTQMRWPGNARQLSSHLNKKVLMANTFFIKYDELDEDLNDMHFSHDESLVDLTLSELKSLHIRRTLQHFHGDREKTRQKLQISQRTMQRYMSQFQLN